MAGVRRFTICALLITLTLSYSRFDGWRTFSGVQSDKSRLHVLYDWPSNGGSYMLDYTAPIEALEVSDVMLQTMGIFRHSLTWRGVEVKNLFKRPRATALFVLDGLCDAAVVKSPKNYSVNQNGLYGDLHSDMTAMFQGDHVLRYFSRLFNDKAISLSMSGDAETALKISSAKSNINVQVLLNERNRGLLSQVEYPIPVTIETNSAMIDLGSNKVYFDLNDQVDLLLFTELAVMMNTIETLPVNHQVTDGVPDVFVLAVSSLQSVRAKYGSDSVQMKAASQLAVACVVKMSNKLIDIYDGDVITQLLSLVWEKGLDVLPDHSDGSTLNDDPSTICNKINNDASEFVACYKTTCKFVRCEELIYQRSGDSNRGVRQTAQLCTSDYCPDESYSRTENFNAMFGIIAFVTIVLLAAVFGVSWAMWTLDPGKDSIIYQMTSPRVKVD